MAGSGTRKSDLRHLHLHRVAFEKLREQPAVRRQCLELVERWLASPEQASSHPWLLQWREMLADWPIEQMARTVLDPEGGQTLRRCSPLGPALQPRERWEALAEFNRRFDRRTDELG
jgi:hypothetical protein